MKIGMPLKLALLITIVPILLPACGGGGGASASNIVSSQPVSVSSRCSPYAKDNYLTADYYVDAAIGSDSNNGSSSSPWKTLTKALAAPSPAVIHFNNGNYGKLTETLTPTRTGYLTLRASPGHQPTLTGIYISYGTKVQSNLRIVGFSIYPDYLPNGTEIVSFNNLTNLEFHDNTITTNKYATASPTPGAPYTYDGVKMTNVSSVLFKSNSITEVARGILIQGTDTSRVQCNYISPKSGVAIQYLSGSSNVIIDDNHIRGGAWTKFPDDPDAPDLAHSHSTMVSLRSDRLIVRNNIMHGMGTTSAIRFYPPDVAGGLTAYSNITIEGNLIYDVHNTQVLQFQNYADQVLVRNNTVVSQYRPGACVDGITGDARYRYETAMYASPATGFPGSGLKLYNNILIGISFFPSTVDEKNNIMWSYSPDGTSFMTASPSGTSKIVTSAYGGCGTHSNYFENGFFLTPPIFSFNHQQLLGYKPWGTAEAKNFGDAGVQLDTILGSLDANNSLIEATSSRIAGQHSAGAYEP